MDRILYRYKNCFEHILKKHGEDFDKASIQIYVNKIENRGLHLKLKMDIALNF